MCPGSESTYSSPPFFSRRCRLGYNTLVSIWSSHYDSLVSTHIRGVKLQIGKYRARYEAGEHLLSIAASIRMSKSVSFSPMTLCRWLLKEVLQLRKSKDVNKFLKALHLLDDERLRSEIQECMKVDMNEPRSKTEAIRSMVGSEFEHRLEETLRNYGIPFQTEHDLRAQGNAKTPDVLLYSPIKVRGHEVIWIDSKATFGDHHVFNRSKCYQQFASYANRYGPGLVVFWFGFQASVPVPKDVLYVEGVPALEEIEALPGV